MKNKYFILLITLITIISITSCANNRANNSDNNSNENMNENSDINSERKVSKKVSFEGETVKGLSETQIIQKIKEIAAKMDKEPQDAVLREDNWEVERNESEGLKINIEKTLEMILKGEDYENVKYSTEILVPGITSKELEEGVRELGKFSTTILDQKVSRVNNIEIAAQCLNNIKVLQGEVFSFNETLGRRTKDKGYEKAPIIIKTKNGAKKAYGIGGGICQISSTLYNAVKLAGMEIIERHPHSKKVGYVPLGDDASVSYGALDFKFRNNKEVPVMMKIYLTQP